MIKNHFALSCLLGFSISLAAYSDDESRFWVQAELAPVWQTRNDVQIPADTGTRFSLVSFGRGPVLGFRAYFGYRFNDRHEVRALFAPLSLDVTGRFSAPVNFENVVFGTSADTVGHYRFNSYRLTYRYVLVRDEAWKLNVGFTAKIRDAEIRLSQGSLTATRANVGFVPLIHLSVTRKCSEHFSISMDLDGLVSPYGRAEDLALLAEYKVHDRLELLAGYRTVEGGSEGGGNVYAFAWLHFATFGARYGF